MINPNHKPFMRILIALGVFLALLSIVVVVTVTMIMPSHSPSTLLPAETSKVTKNTPPAVFYKSVGQNRQNAARTEPSDAPLAQKLSEQYTLELKQANTIEEAEREINRLAEAGIDAYFTPVNKNGQVIYRIRRGVYPSLPMAKRAALDLKKNSRLESTVTKL